MALQRTPKAKIPLATKYFLESLNDKYKWIAKDEKGTVWCYKFKPEKYTQDNNKKELFDFLSWEDEKPTNIKELLENCEVIEDE